MLFDKIKKQLNKNYINGTWSNFFQTYVTDEDLLKETTYNKCIKYNAESVAKCPIVVKLSNEKGEEEATTHSLYERLRLRPNPFMTISDCVKAWISIGEHEGISALYITKNKELYPARIRQILVDDAGVIESMKSNPVAYELDVAGQYFFVFDKECIIYRSGISWDNIRSINSNKDFLRDSVNTTLGGQKYLSGLFKNGMCSKVLVQLSSDLKDKKALAEKQKQFNELFNTDGRLFVAPAGYQISALNMSLADSQFKEIRSLSRIEIANAFGLTAAMIGEDSKAKVEEDTLRYLQDTLLFKLEVIEQEFDYKLLSSAERKKGYKIRFNTNVLLRTSAKVQQDILCNYHMQGIYTTNDVRVILGMNKIEGGDTLLFPSGQCTLDQLINGETTWANNSNNAKGGGKEDE